MEPQIQVGSMVFYQASKGYQVGDIITFKRGNITVTHRIFSIKNEQFETKGDANKNADPQLVNKNRCGRARLFTIPYIGKLPCFLKLFLDLCYCWFFRLPFLWF